MLYFIQEKDVNQIMMNDREKKVLCFGMAIGILLGVIAMKLVGARGAVVLAALAFLVPLVPELRARVRQDRGAHRMQGVSMPSAPSLGKPHLETPHVTLPHIEKPHLEAPHIEVPHVAMPHLEKPHIEMPEVDLSSDWLSNKAIVIYFMIFIISFVIGYVVLN